jgi:anaerobic selenocysteine-containing dehydrogenase
VSVRGPDGARHVPSACPLDCPDACSLDVTVAGGRVVAIGGSHVNPVTGGYICAKVRRFPEHMYGPARILHPGVRAGAKGRGEFRPVSWEAALDLVAERMRTVRRSRGGEGILPFSYGGSNGYVSQDTTDARLFSRLGASRLARTVCAAPSGRAAAGLYGKMPGVAYQDYARASLVVVWGMNPSVSGIHLMPFLHEAQRRGASIVVVDPRRTRLAERADLHLAVRPGTDLPLALAVIRWIFAGGWENREFLEAHVAGADELRRRAEPWTLERAAGETGIPAADIQRFADLYARSSPAVIRCGWGIERTRNGGSAVAAVLALPAVAGKFGVRGGGYTMSNFAAWKELDALAASRSTAAPAREINMNRLGEALEASGSGSVDLLFVYNCNPAVTIPNQQRVLRGLAREDLFTVVFDPVMTDTARYADVVLPAATFLERTELSRGYGAFVLQEARAVADPPGEARPNHEVFADLCRRTGVARPGDPETAEEIADAILDTSPRSAALRRGLRTEGIAFLEEGPAPVQFVHVFPRTEDGRIHLVPEALDREAPGGLYGYAPLEESRRYPLALISPATDRTISSTLGELYRGPVSVEVHPSDAAERNIGNGDDVRVFNSLGEVRCTARVSAALRSGVAMLPKGIWRHNTASATTATALAPDSLTDLGGGACFNDARVQIERSAGP